MKGKVKRQTKKEFREKMTAESRKRQQQRKETILRQLNTSEALRNVGYNSGSPDVQSGPSKLMRPVHDKLQEHYQNYQHPDHKDTYRLCVECDKPQE